MSQENVEIVRRLGEVWNESGFAGLIEAGLVHPEVEYHDDARWPEARSTFGTSAFLERFSDFMDVFGGEARVETEQVLDGDGDRVVSIFRLTGRGRASGLPHEHRWGYLCRVRDGQIYFMQAFLEPEQALEAAGVRDR
jgi:ketosteroid isomerase-like protein